MSRTITEEGDELLTEDDINELRQLLLAALTENDLAGEEDAA